MKYSMTCSCGHDVQIDALDRKEAVDKLVEAGKVHSRDCLSHGFSNLPEDEMRQTVHATMKESD